MKGSPGRYQRRWAARQAKRQDGKLPNLSVPRSPVHPSLEKRRISAPGKEAP